jgi:hypothetical protein
MSLKRLVLGAALFAGANAAGAAQVSLLPAVQTVNVGDVFVLTIEGSGFVDNLDGGGLDVGFDPTVLQINAPATIDAAWEFGSDGGSTGGPGVWKDIVFNTFSHAINGTFPIATVSFTALQPSAGTPVVLSLNGGPAENPFGSGGTLVPVSFAGATIEVKAVPLPVSLWLVTGALATLVRKRRSG